MPRHTILLAIHSSDRFTREISLPGAGDLAHLVDIFGMALALLPQSSTGTPASTPEAGVSEEIPQVPRQALPSFKARTRPRSRRLH